MMIGWGLKVNERDTKEERKGGRERGTYSGSIIFLCRICRLVRKGRKERSTWGKGRRGMGTHTQGKEGG